MRCQITLGGRALTQCCWWRRSCRSTTRGGAAQEDCPPPRDKDRGDYFAGVPAYGSGNSLGLTEFFFKAALGMLQSPCIIEEMLVQWVLVDVSYDRDVGLMAIMLSSLFVQISLYYLCVTNSARQILSFPLSLQINPK